MYKKNLVYDFFSRPIKFRGIKRELEVPSVRKIISIVGPRRSGKTWFFYYLYEKIKDGMYVNFEDISFRNIEPTEFFEILEIYSEIRHIPRTLLLDEVQVIPGWDTLVRSLYDRGFEIYITGSSSKLLPREISTLLRGRTLTYYLLPFSFREFLRARNIIPEPAIYEKRGLLLKFLREYLEYGGFPEVVLTEFKERFLSEYADEIFYRDFVERHKIRSIEFGRFLFEFCFQNFANEISLRKIRNFFPQKISSSTLYKYIDLLQDTLAIFFVEKYSGTIYERKSWPRKIYVCDTGISKIVGITMGDLTRMMENTVFLELYRKKNLIPSMRIYYWKDSKKREVDFVVQTWGKISQLIQVTYASQRSDISTREIKNLLKASEALHCNDLLIITWDYEDTLIVDGKKIQLLPLWRWLTQSIRKSI